MLVPDGAYTFANGQARFHRAPAPSDLDLERLLDTLIRRITRTLVRTGVLVEDPEYPWLDIHPDNGGDTALEQLAGAAVRYRIAVGPIAGRKTMTLHSPVNLSGECAPAKALTAARDGFSLNAAVACEAHQRDKLERLCRYVSRGPIALERLSIDGDGLVVHELKHPFRDGTTHVLFEPLDFLARLAALVPRPRTHLVRYHGLLLRASCPSPFGPAFGCSKSLPAILSPPMRNIVTILSQAPRQPRPLTTNTMARRTPPSPNPLPRWAGCNAQCLSIRYRLAKLSEVRGTLPLRLMNSRH